MLPSHACCVFSRLHCNGHSLLLSFYLSRIGRIENLSCSACGHFSQDTSCLILHRPTTDSLRRSLFGDFLVYDLWSRPWGVARLLELHGLPPYPYPSKGRATTTTWLTFFVGELYTVFLHFRFKMTIYTSTLEENFIVYAVSQTM